MIVATIGVFGALLTRGEQVLSVDTLSKNWWIIARKQAKWKKNREIGPMIGFSTFNFKLSNSFLLNCQLLLCQAPHICSAKLNSAKNAYGCHCIYIMYLVLSVSASMFSQQRLCCRCSPHSATCLWGLCGCWLCGWPRPALLFLKINPVLE